MFEWQYSFFYLSTFDMVSGVSKSGIQISQSTFHKAQYFDNIGSPSKSSKKVI